jgi:hypothetical protein
MTFTEIRAELNLIDLFTLALIMFDAERDPGMVEVVHNRYDDWKEGPIGSGRNLYARFWLRTITASSRPVAAVCLLSVKASPEPVRN